MQQDITKDVLGLVRKFIKENKISLSEFARRSGVSKAWLSKLYNSDANLSMATATKILDFLGYKFEVKKSTGSRLKKTAELCIVIKKKGE